ncbi:flagellar hook-length control protein FliK [Aurantimonas endophytica]|uniref:Flagellar hook-length control protein-like C-terminal domain-containing protein n=1 Tax=Aurantimonas endophytica TaxID=1522175 RepID=A0A7W6MP42_9HYPH|nr:flagellar hook-length control protein FliK [Aurantimonas endophytica]MBB4002492.1 hypothetical protein [Aurantimonas endophytica]MCO6401887.1 hypothetical protein [Aurantimonas endophytica]
MSDDARTELFRRLDATAAAVFHGDAASLRFGAPGQGSSGTPIRADFVSMRTDFAPAGRGDDRGAAAAAFAARTGALGRLAAAGGAAQAGAGSLDGPSQLAAEGRPATGNSSFARPENGQAEKLTGPLAGALETAAETAPAPNGAADPSRSKAKGGDAAAERLSATKSEDLTATVEAPVLAGSTTASTSQAPARQVASVVGNAFSEFRSGPDGSEGAGNLRLRAGGAALKTVQIQLQPAHFGKVDVTLRLIDGQLAIQLLASEPETVMRLKDDAEGLRSLLSQSGFAVEDAAISIGLRDPAQSRGTSTPGFADNAPGGGSADGQAANGGASRNETGGQGGAAGQGGRDGNVRGERGSASADAPGLARGLDRSVYL